MNDPRPGPVPDADDPAAIPVQPGATPVDTAANKRVAPGCAAHPPRDPDAPADTAVDDDVREAPDTTSDPGRSAAAPVDTTVDEEEAPGPARAAGRSSVAVDTAADEDKRGSSGSAPAPGRSSAVAATSVEPMRPRVATTTPEERAALEAELDFLLRSLADLDAERAAGDLTTAQHDRLTGGYTARAAVILRILDRDPAPDPEASAGSGGRWRRMGVAAALVAVVAVAVAVIPHAIGDRGSGQTITGNAQSGGQPTDEALARAVSESPDDPQARLAYARFLLDSGDVVEAIEQFDAAVRLDPTNPEALAYSGWILALAGMSEPEVGTTDTGLERIDRAIAADPGYPDAHAFRGLILLNTGNAAGAASELQRYLDLAPDSPLRSEVEAALDQARAQARAARP